MFKKALIITMIFTLLLSSFGGVSFAKEKKDNVEIVYQDDLLETEKELLDAYDGKTKYEKIQKSTMKELRIAENKKLIGQVLERWAYEDGVIEEDLAIIFLTTSYNYYNSYRSDGTTSYGVSATLVLALTIRYEVDEDGDMIIGTSETMSRYTAVTIVNQTGSIHATKIVMSNKVVLGSHVYNNIRTVSTPDLNTTYTVSSTYSGYLSLPSGIMDGVYATTEITLSNGYMITLNVFTS